MWDKRNYPRSYYSYVQKKKRFTIHQDTGTIRTFARRFTAYIVKSAVGNTSLSGLYRKEVVVRDTPTVPAG